MPEGLGRSSSSPLAARYPFLIPAESPLSWFRPLASHEGRPFRFQGALHAVYAAFSEQKETAALYRFRCALFASRVRDGLLLRGGECVVCNTVNK